MKGVFEDLAFIQLICIALQPIFFIIGEIAKITGPSSSFYYPNGGMFFAWILIILLIYAPYFIQYYFATQMINTCIRASHPNYDFGKKDGYIVVEKSLETSIGLKMGVYNRHLKDEQEEGPANTEETETKLLP